MLGEWELNNSWKASPNRWGRSEVNASFSIGFGNGLYMPVSRICLTYSFRVISSLYLEYSRHIPRIFFPSHLVICLEYTGLFLCLRIGPGLQQQCNWDATAVTGVSRVFNIQRQTWRARMSTPERQQMQPYMAQHRLWCRCCSKSPKISWSWWWTHKTCAMHRQEGK